jgi:hypothetical protein
LGTNEVLRGVPASADEEEFSPAWSKNSLPSSVAAPSA